MSTINIALTDEEIIAVDPAHRVTDAPPAAGPSAYPCQVCKRRPAEFIVWYAEVFGRNHRFYSVEYVAADRDFYYRRDNRLPSGERVEYFAFYTCSHCLGLDSNAN